MDSLLLEVALGLAVMFATIAALAAVITELVARFLGLRGRFLLLGLRELLDGPEVLTATVRGPTTVAGDADHDGPEVNQQGPEESATSAFLATPIMQTQGLAGSLVSRHIVIAKHPEHPERLAKIEFDAGQTNRWRRWVFTNPLRGLPSYVSAQTFSSGVLDIVVPPSDRGQKARTATLRQQVAAMDQYPTLRRQLQSLLLGVQGDVGEFRTAIEQWYDGHMDRVSGWYKRHVAKWSLAIGMALVLALNVNTVTIAQTLFSDDATRAALTAVAESSAACDDSKPAGECFAALREQLSTVRSTGVPIGWSVVAECSQSSDNCDVWARYGLVDRSAGWWDWHPVLVVVGLALTVVALVPGARVWFDLLGRLGSLRTTGPRPVSASPDQ